MEPPPPPPPEPVPDAEDEDDELDEELKLANPVKCFVQIIKSEPALILQLPPAGRPSFAASVSALQVVVISVNAVTELKYPTRFAASPTNEMRIALLKVNLAEPDPISILLLGVLMVFCSCGNGGFDTTVGRVIIPLQVVGPLAVILLGIVTCT